MDGGNGTWGPITNVFRYTGAWHHGQRSKWMIEEELPRKKDAVLAPRHYDGWSVNDFDEHLAALRVEMARAEATRAARQASASAAASFFKPPN